MKLKKGDRVEVLGWNEDVKIRGTIVRNKSSLPYPYWIAVDFETSEGLDATTKKHYEDHLAGPYDKEELIKL